VEDYLYDLQLRRTTAGDSDDVIGSSTQQYYHALSALANSMALMIDEVDGPTRKRWREKDGTSMLAVFWRNVLEVFFHQLGLFRESPSCAALAARCIRLFDTLAPNDQAGSSCLDLSRLPCVLYNAQEYGKAYNALLEEESSNLCDLVANMQQ
jgi:hypothetical protein